MGKAQILVVDDEHQIRSALIDFLSKRFDCVFAEAGDGEEAVKFVCENKCDLILLDIKMPKKSGLAVAKEAKEKNPGIDILIVSAWDSDDVAEEAIKLGVTDYLIKPIDLKVLEMKVGGILKKRGQFNKT